MKVISFKIEESLLEQLDAYAIKNHMFRSEVIRRAIELLIKEEREKETVPTAKVEKMKLW